ncbi:hypothetical protein GCK32_022167, partial [Trichostrongylus colubriformis]
IFEGKRLLLQFKTLLLSTFKTCVELQFCSPVNLILICTPSALPNSDRQMTELNDRLRSLERLLEIDRYFTLPEIVPLKPNCSFSAFREFE